MTHPGLDPRTRRNNPRTESPLPIVITGYVVVGLAVATILTLAAHPLALTGVAITGLLTVLVVSLTTA